MPAASYFTVCEEELSNSDIRRMNRGCCYTGQVKYNQNICSTNPVNRVSLAIQFDDLDDAHLKQLIHIRNLVKVLQDVFHSLRHGAIRQEHKSVPLASGIRLGSKECLD